MVSRFQPIHEFCVLRDGFSCHFVSFRSLGDILRGFGRSWKQVRILLDFRNPPQELRSPGNPVKWRRFVAVEGPVSSYQSQFAGLQTDKKQTPDW